MLRYSFLLFLFLLFSSPGGAQTSIHIEELTKYEEQRPQGIPYYDSINEFRHIMPQMKVRSGLDKIVFGYHPFWGGSNYLNYQWDLLSDLCYFSYEVDPESGHAVTYHDWLTSPAIDSAFANATRVHLCVTLFSGQSIFFNNPESRQTLTNNLISLVRQRGAHGVSFDFEAVPASQGENMVNYVAEFAAIFRDSIPGGIISIAMPAVDWSDIFDVQELNDNIDLYMIMGYDYYWNGSSQAGPVDPHYSMTSGYNYSVSRTVSYYESEGMPVEKMLIGVPYYAREWATASATPPSATTGWGEAYTWAKIKNNTSGNYSPANKHLEPNSFGPYYAYYGGGWYQCFVNDVNSLGRRYKLVNRRGLAGIGIWALGYDNGYTDLWEVIMESFASGTQVTLQDSLYDSGGPSWNYYDDEDYVITLHGEQYEAMQIEFTAFKLEEGFDSLWIYDGYYPEGYLVGSFSGNQLPPALFTLDVMSLRFKSDHSSTAEGWMAIVNSFPISVEETMSDDIEVSVIPNPFVSKITIQSDLKGITQIYTLDGRMVLEEQKNTSEHKIDLSVLPSGVYILAISNNTISKQRKIIKY